MSERYELTYIVPIKYLDNELQTVISKVTKLVKDSQGSIAVDNVIGKQRLSYPINGVFQGTYVALEFEMPSGELKKIENQLKLMPEVLRFLVVKKRVKTAAESRREQQIQEKLRKDKEKELAKLEEENLSGLKKIEADEEKAAEAAKPSANEKPKVSLEDLDKKLDEILKEDVL
ncbi:MAG: 30S ribosomal protein S6 [Parcubacteria group bacterium]